MRRWWHVLFLSLLLCGCLKFNTGGDVPKPPGPAPIVEPVKPAPIPEAGFRVMVIREVTDKGLTPAQLSALSSAEFVDYLEANCVKDSGGRPEWRLFDLTTAPTLESDLWQKAYALALSKVPGNSLLVSNGITGDVIPLPADLPSIMAEVKKYKEPPAVGSAPGGTWLSQCDEGDRIRFPGDQRVYVYETEGMWGIHYVCLEGTNDGFTIDDQIVEVLGKE
jgi:hypothetical protein